MGDDTVFWDRKLTKKEVVRILRDESDPRFIDIAALLLSRNNSTKMVFSEYLDEERFYKNWRKIKRKMRRNKWSDSRIVFWDQVYRVLVKGVDKSELRALKQRDVDIDPVMRDIAGKIREVRKKKGWTQKDLAAKTRLSQQTISFVERGYVNISMKTLKRIAGALGLKITLTDTR